MALCSVSHGGGEASVSTLLTNPFNRGKLSKFWEGHYGIIDTVDDDGHTAFSRAAQVNDVHTCKFLLDCGSKPSGSAAKYGHSEVFDMLDETEKNLKHRGKDGVNYVQEHLLEDVHMSDLSSVDRGNETQKFRSGINFLGKVFGCSLEGFARKK